MAIKAEEALKSAISDGNASRFIRGYFDYEKAILYYEGVGKTKESTKLLQRLEKIFEIVITKGNPDAPYYDKLGPFFILYARHFSARILEMLNIDLRAATANRVAALDFAIGVEWIEQVLNIMIDLLIEDYIDHCLRYLKFTKDKKEQLIEELSIQIGETHTKSSFWQRKQSAEKAAAEIYSSFLRLLGLMIEKYNKGEGFLKEGLKVLRMLKVSAEADLEYLDQRMMALEAKIRSNVREEINDSTISHVPSKIVPHTIIDDPQIPVLQDLLKSFVKKKGMDLDVRIAQIPILGANPAGSPHLAILGQTGVGKTTLTKQILKENVRAQDCAAIVFDHHFEYADIADSIVQIGGTRRDETSVYFDVEQIGDTFRSAQKFIQNQQEVFSRAGADPSELAEKIKKYESDTRPTINKFIIDTIEGLIDKEESSVLPIKSGEIVVFWIVMDDAQIATTIVSTFIKYILQMAIHERLPHKTIMVTEEAQRLANDEWVRNVTSEGRKFGLFLIAISQVAEFDPWIVSNSELSVFKLRKIDPQGPISDIFTPEAKLMIPNLDVGEYLTYYRDKRSWVLSYNPESLTPIHAKNMIAKKISRLQDILY